MLEVDRILRTLSEHEVRYVVVGGLALVVHGSAHVTSDIDLCYARDGANLDRLSRALAPLHPRLRGAPEGLPFHLDPPTLKAGLNFTLVTDSGDVDLLGEISGIGGFDQAARNAVERDLYGHLVKIMSLDDLERAKRAAGRRKDLLALDEIEELRRRIAKDDPTER